MRSPYDLECRIRAHAPIQTEFKFFSGGFVSTTLLLSPVTCPLLTSSAARSLITFFGRLTKSPVLQSNRHA